MKREIKKLSYELVSLLEELLREDSCIDIANEYYYVLENYTRQLKEALDRNLWYSIIMKIFYISEITFLLQQRTRTCTILNDIRSLISEIQTKIALRIFKY